MLVVGINHSNVLKCSFLVSARYVYMHEYISFSQKNGVIIIYLSYIVGDVTLAWAQRSTATPTHFAVSRTLHSPQDFKHRSLH
jgi:hypothetical protein